MERDFLVVLITQNRKAASKHLEEKKILLLLPRFKREVVKFNEKLLKREIIRAQELFQKTIFCSLDVNFQYVYPGVTICSKKVRQGINFQRYGVVSAHNLPFSFLGP
jgi:hypothetical protein